MTLKYMQKSIFPRRKNTKYRILRNDETVIQIFVNKDTSH